MGGRSGDQSREIRKRSEESGVGRREGQSGRDTGDRERGVGGGRVRRGKQQRGVETESGREVERERRAGAKPRTTHWK